MRGGVFTSCHLAVVGCDSLPEAAAPRHGRHLPAPVAAPASAPWAALWVLPPPPVSSPRVPALPSAGLCTLCSAL